MSYEFAPPPNSPQVAAGGNSEECFFGSPSKPGRLRSLLAESIDRVPADGEILWSTYYLANTHLMERLSLAASRGVKIIIALEASPRRPAVNAEAFKRLHGLSGLRIVPVKSRFFAHLHEKLYYFSHPQPFFLAGSYNPSMDASLDAAAIRDIGDQDQGHNVLVRIADPAAVARVHQHLLAYVTQARGKASGPCDDPAVIFLPEDGRSQHLSWLAGEWQSMHIAMSHLRDSAVVKILAGQARRGTQVHLISHECQRRFPARNEFALRKAGVNVWRYRHPQQWPMHSKYTLLRNGQEQVSLYGSLNFTKTSRWLNREVLIQSRALRTYDSLLANWNDIREEIERGYA
jgi:phosphatidylserine/phosphatidylglycerophosphate/cardiolipin synthase-like enzyme